MSEKDEFEESVMEVKKWVAQQPHLPKNIPDEELKQFVHSCYNRIDVACKTVDTYYRMKSRVQDFFWDRSLDNPGLKKVAGQIQTCILPKRTPSGFSVMCSRIRNGSDGKFILEDAIKLFLLSIDTCLREHPRPSKGIVFVYDNTGVSLAHLASISLSTLKKYFTYVQEAMPVRLKSIHVVNVTPIMSHVMTLIRPFIRKDRLKYIHLHTADKIKDMFEVVPEAILPKEYGGEEASMDQLFDQTLKLIRANEAWFRFDETLRIDESKLKPGRDNSKQQAFVSSFKKLDID